MTDPAFHSCALDSSIHDLESFACGVSDLDDWLCHHVQAAQRARVARTFVWTETSSSERVVAFYALSAHAIRRLETPSRIGRGVPDPVPAALIAKLALDQRLHGQALGGVLLADALARILHASESGPAVRAIIVDAHTNAGRGLYLAHGFTPLPGRDDRLIIRAETVARSLGAEPRQNT